MNNHELAKEIANGYSDVEYDYAFCLTTHRVQHIDGDIGTVVGFVEPNSDPNVIGVLFDGVLEWCYADEITITEIQVPE